MTPCYICNETKERLEIVAEAPSLLEFLTQERSMPRASPQWWFTVAAPLPTQECLLHTKYTLSPRRQPRPLTKQFLWPPLTSSATSPLNLAAFQRQFFNILSSPYLPTCSDVLSALRGDGRRFFTFSRYGRCRQAGVLRYSSAMKHSSS